MITVIIPALNEATTVAQVVRYAWAQPGVQEVIVVDDKSTDDTVALAQQAGATIITSTCLGKGVSMKEGLLCAHHEWIVFLDADIDPYPLAAVQELVAPLRNDTADFVKACFERNAGRVTELVAKPLLNILFPGMPVFEQPLSGMIAGKKSLLQQVDFYGDYGVDVGLLIDMHLLGARIAEVNIGYIENKSQPWRALGKMSREVSKAIVTKALQQNKAPISLEELHQFAEIRGQMEFAIKEGLRGLEKLVVFDMDRTLLQGRFIDACAKTFGFEKTLIDIRSSGQDAMVTTKNIARLLKGLDVSQVLAVADSIPLVSDAKAVITALKQRGYVVGIISDSYDVVAQHICTLTGADFSLAHELEFSRSTATGEVRIPSFFIHHPQSLCSHAVCKTHALQHIATQYDISLNNCIAVGDSENDLCMIRHAGVGVSFCSASELLNYQAQINIEVLSFREMLDFA
jgi:glucosyl-3-phosphoglycerate synthase